MGGLRDAFTRARVSGERSLRQMTSSRSEGGWTVGMVGVTMW